VRRPAVVTALIFGILFFAGFSLLLARGLTGAGAERAKVLEVVRAEARGNWGAVLDRLGACRDEPACAAVTRERVARLRAPGRVEILNYEPSARLVFVEEQLGTGRVAWRAGDGLPVVQCVRVRRTGIMAGAEVELLAVSAPIGREASCPR
jgi:hypothetical protein